MRIYLSGPISTKLKGETKESLRQAFHDVEAAFLEIYPEATIVNPLKVQAACGETCEGGDPDDSHPSHSWKCWMKFDIIAMLDCDGICLLPGWTHSRGARIEQGIAEGLEMQHFFANKNRTLKGWNIV